MDVVTLNSLDSNLNVTLSDGNCTAKTMSEGGFAFMWGGVRATHGITSGRFYFKVALTKKIFVKKADKCYQDLSSNNLARIGVSFSDTEVGKLGEVPNSWGFGGTGKKSTDNEFMGYGRSFGPGDEVCCFVDLESQPATLSFSKNGVDLGTAYEIPTPTDQSTALFPHILLKNMVVQVDFTGARPLHLGPAEPWQEYINGFAPWKYALTNSAIIATGPSSMPPFTECEVIMLVGLPGSGKTSWANEHAANNPDKEYVILGTDRVMEQMRVKNLGRQKNYSGRFQKLMDLASPVFNSLLDKAAKLPRNYILDQTNVYERARSRKLSKFKEKGFTIKAVVFVLPDDVLSERHEKQRSDEGKFIPDDALDDMKANFILPTEGAEFSSVEFIEVQPPEAFQIVAEQNKSGQQGSKKRPPPEAQQGGNKKGKKGGGGHAPGKGQPGGGQPAGGGGPPQGYQQQHMGMMPGGMYPQMMPNMGGWPVMMVPGQAVAFNMGHMGMPMQNMGMQPGYCMLPQQYGHQQGPQQQHKKKKHRR